MVTLSCDPAWTCVTAPAASAFSVFSPMSMFPDSSVRPHSFTTLAAISASRIIVVSCWQGLMDVQFLARDSSTKMVSQLGQKGSEKTAQED